MTNPLEQIANLIDKSQRILITSHKDPDGDSIGSQLALAELLEGRNKEFRIINQGHIPSKYGFLDSQGKILSQDLKEDFKPDLVIVLECAGLDRIGWVGKLIEPEAKIINIDHHLDNERFGTVNLLNSDASAVGEMIYDIFKYLNYPISQNAATNLYAAILTDTGRFGFNNTTSRCLEICAELIRCGANPKLVTDRIYFGLEKSYMSLLGHLLSSMQFFENNRICLFELKKGTLEKYGVGSNETEGLVNHTLFTKGVAVGILLIELEENRVRVGLRSQNNFDVSKLAKEFGGGGHKNAAGCIVSAKLEEVKQLILKQIGKELKCELGGVAITK